MAKRSINLQQRAPSDAGAVDRAKAALLKRGPKPLSWDGETKLSPAERETGMLESDRQTCANCSPKA